MQLLRMLESTLSAVVEWDHLLHHLLGLHFEAEEERCKVTRRESP
jgi:hypothetical protein